MNLQLEYSCTKAEMEEAQSLQLQQQCGGGPKWRSRLILYSSLALGVALIYIRFKTEVPPADRLWVIALAVVVFITVLLVQRFTRTKSAEVIRLEISESELVFNNGSNRTATSWSAFSKSFESPTVFALLDRPGKLLFVVPKRAFPDEASQGWFRTLTSQPQAAVAASSRTGASVPANFATTKGVALTLQLKYRDYVIRMVTSWRTKGIAVGLLLFITGTCLFSPDRPNAVNSRGKTLLIMLAMTIPMLAVVLFVISFASWRSEKKYLALQQVALSAEGIEFASPDGSGFLAWATYKYYLENRWSFFVWNPRGSLWFMFPKRQFGSLSDLRQCRELLQTNLQPARWFFL
jgi:hypothetical protein